MISQPLVLVGFPGIGKTALVEQLGSYVAKEYSFEQLEPSTKEPQLKGLQDLILTSPEPIIALPCHLSLLVALEINQIKIWTAFPADNHKKEYLKQLMADDKDQAEVDFIDKYWDVIHDSITRPCKHKQGIVEVHGGDYKVSQSDMFTSAVGETIQNWSV